MPLNNKIIVHKFFNFSYFFETVEFGASGYSGYICKNRGVIEANGLFLHTCHINHVYTKLNLDYISLTFCPIYRLRVAFKRNS